MRLRAWLRQQRFELACVLAILAVESIPLSLGRPLIWSAPPVVWFALATALLGLTIGWSLGARARGCPGVVRFTLSRKLLVAVTVCILLLASLSIVSFLLPMRRSFWMGQDEPWMLALAVSPNPQLAAEEAVFRPMDELAAQVALAIAPNSVEGFLWLATALRVLIAVGVGSLVLLATGQPTIAMLAAVLSMVMPTDPWQFFAIEVGNYYVATAAFVVGVALFFWSHVMRKRWLLVCGCGLLGMSLLTIETGYPPAVLAAAALVIPPVRRSWTGVWLLAWLGTVGLCAVRLAVHVVGGRQTYQGNVAAHLPSAPQALANLGALVAPAVTFVPNGLAAMRSQPQTAVVPVLLALAAIVVATRGERTAPIRPPLAVALAPVVLSAATAVAAVLAYTQWGLTGRTELFAVPWQSAFWACLVGVVCVYVPTRLRLTLTAAASILLVSAGIGQARLNQDLLEARPFQYAKTVAVMNRIHELVPRARPGASLLLVSPRQDEPPPLGPDFHVTALARLVLGIDAYQVNRTYRAMPEVTCTASACLAPDMTELLRFYEPTWRELPLNRLIVLLAESDGRVSVAQSFPTQLLPSGSLAVDYNPDALIEQDPADVRTPLPFLRSPSWLSPYALPRDATSPD